ncbi:MAG TPA: FkbM family methyltransferase, partial [Methylotenera sp.]|nr:FkbM family methyltransferase [Methylotenera sp.]
MHMLWRALKHINNGFYIDVGAAWPDEHSVTKAFYDNGWNGINIEPNPAFISQYKTSRVKDINLQVAVSDKSGKAELFFIENTGLSSMDQATAESHKSIGFESNFAEVEVVTLKQICMNYAKSKDIHFLKVDVEGLEEKVLVGNDWSQFRPWIVLVEATLPMSQAENYEQWEHILLSADYQFVYADGLNRFYIAKEHAELAQSFKYPPNVFDGFVLASQIQAEVKASEAEAKASEAETKLVEAKLEIDSLRHHSHHWWVEAEEKSKQLNALNETTHNLNAKIAELNASSHHWWQTADSLSKELEQFRLLHESVVHSHSWRITYPLRLLGKFTRWLVYGSYHWLTFSPSSRPRRVTKQFVISAKQKINQKPT